MAEPQLFSSAPQFTLDFEIVYITAEFTKYQMSWHYAWIVITLVFMFVPKIGFFYEMTQLHQNFWSRQQVKPIVLLCLTNTYLFYQVESRLSPAAMYCCRTADR